MIDDQKLAALANWLTAGAQPQTDFIGVVGEIGKRLLAAGAPADLVGVYMTTIHPMMNGRLTYWTPRAGAKDNYVTYADMKNDIWVGTAAEICQRTARIVRHRIGETPDLDNHSSGAQLKARGYVDYVVLPLPLVHSVPSALSVGTKSPGGFTDAEVTSLRRLQAPLARVVETEQLYSNTVTILSTYVGRNAGEMVLRGQIIRGDAEIIPAVILFTDLVGFTAYSNRHTPNEVIATLNRYFDALNGPIRDNGGEVLKLIGDGLLAIFPTPDDITAQEAAAVGALAAVDDARAALTGADFDFRAALHVGDIHYGNIGSATRLDFTAIGPAVNLAARMLGAATDLGAATVCSADFAALAPARTTRLASVEFKGFDAPAEVHAVA